MLKAGRGYLCFILVMMMGIFPSQVFANVFPNQLWAPLESFTLALNSRDDQGMVKWGEVLIGIMETEPDSADKTAFLAGKYEQVSRAAERLGLYEKAVAYYTKYIPYGQRMNWTDGVLFAQKKVYLLQSYLNIYIQDADYMPPYYGARFEPRRGIYFGATYDNDVRILDYNQQKIQQYFPKKNSMYLIYLEFGDDIETLGRYRRYFDEAKRNGIAVELAWNTYSSLEDIQNHKQYIQKTIDYIADSGLQVFLRFANEMNIGPNGDEPKAYINAYREVSAYAKTKDNIAMVWAPSDVGALDRPYENYYPGDEYVDWIGASLYAIRYFQGIRNHGSQTDPLNTYFITGDFANPVLRMKELIGFMEERGIQKPVMVTECGTAHYVRPEGEDTTAWAMAQMRRMYGDLIRVYPQIKAINYFNVKRPNEVNAYELYTSQPLNDLYNRMVDSPYYLQSTSEIAPFGYRFFDGGVIRNDAKLSVAGYYPKTLYNQVKYYVDGKQIGESNDSPYDTTLAGLGEGNHTLLVELYDNGTLLLQKNVDFTVENPVRVRLDGEYVEFPDQQPVIVSGRTLVPARGVFEKMGMAVSWDEAKRKVIIKGSGLKVELVIDERIISVNDAKSEMDVAAQLIGGRTMIPLRAVSEATGAKVDWMETEKTVVITTR